MPTTHSNIAIAGGGLLGRLLAWQLLEAGNNVTLFDAGSLTHSPSAAHTAAGMISPVSEAIDTEPLMYPLGMASLSLWPKWLETLGHCVNYAQQGSLIVAHPHDQALLQQYQHDMQRNLSADAQGQWLDKAQIHALEPDIAEHFHNGMFFPEEAHIDNRQLLSALLERINQLGGQCIANTAVNVSPFTVQHINNKRTETFDHVLDCRGVGAKANWKGVRGVRGEILRVHTQEVQLQRPVRLLHPRYQLYVVPKANNEFVIGATQIESEDNSPVSVQSALELNSALYTVNPAFAEARIIEMQANLRPALNDNRPKIQYTEGLIKVNGLYRHGYLLAPVVVEHTLALLFNRATHCTDFSTVLYQDITQGTHHAKAIA